MIKKIKEELQVYSDIEQGKFLERFFKTGKGQYAEGDKFIGIKVPIQRKIAKKYYRDIDLDSVSELLHDPIHEYRLTALFILVYKFEKASVTEQEQIFNFYLKNTRFINNWDLVDSSARIIGLFLLDKPRDILYKLAKSESLWEQRISILATQVLIQNNQFDDTLKIAEQLLTHKHDLIHKAVGWMLREIGKRDLDAEIKFLNKFYKSMPRTMLRYAIERLSKEKKEKYMAK